MRRFLKIAGIAFFVVFALLVAGSGLFALEVFSRKPLQAVPSTTHASLGRKACIDCHAPIAAEWRQSVHFRSVTGAYWQEAKQLGYLRLYDAIRKPCLNCHAPANVLDLAGAAKEGTELGVECTPNVFREAKGTIPSARSDDVVLGVDCTACHVSTRGIAGAGHRRTAEHATIADRRFRDPALTADSLCGICHRATVNAWKRTSLPANGITCLDCHMPLVSAPSVAGGPARARRSHAFAADKNAAMLAHAVHASLDLDGGGNARFRITNDRVGHYFPSGANWVSVHLRAIDASGRLLREQKEAFGRNEDPFFDFRPFNRDSRLAFGESREIELALPRGHGTIEAVVRYHDWMHTRKDLVKLKREF